MYSAVSTLKSSIKIGDVTIDNCIFKLHRQLTFILLIAFSLIVSTGQFFGDPIDCFTVTQGDIPGNVLDNYCWIQSTFSLPAARNKQVGTEVIYPGVDTLSDPNEPVVYHSYYQWVCYFLFFVAILFHTPYFIWKMIEGGKMKNLATVTHLQNPVYDGTEAAKEAINNKLGKYYANTVGKNTWFYSVGYISCELLNFANVIGQIYFADAFLGGEFTQYGIDVIRYSQMDQSNRTDPMIAVFPRVTKCGLNKVGVAGSIQRHDALCVLPVNMINEKVFIFLWFWYIALAVVTALSLLDRFLLQFSKVRWLRMKIECKCANDVMEKLEDIVKDTSYSDWFVLDLLRKNVNSIHFSDLVEEIDRVMKENAKNKSNGGKNELQSLLPT